MNPLGDTISHCAFLFWKKSGGGIIKLTVTQKKFCDEYLIDCNATRAYKAAYSNIKNDHSARTLASRLLTKVDIKTYIDEQLEKIHNKKTADAQEVLEYLTAVMRGQHTEQTLQLVGDGVQSIADIDVSAKERLKAAELLGKRYGLFTDKINFDGLSQLVIVNDLED